MSKSAMYKPMTPVGIGVVFLVVLVVAVAMSWATGWGWWTREERVFFAGRRVRANR